MTFSSVGSDFWNRKKQTETTTATSATAVQWYSCCSSSSYIVATLAQVQQGATAASHMELNVVGAQPYDTKKLCGKSARMILYDTVNSRSRVGVGPPFTCGRKNQASEYVFAVRCRSNLRSLSNIEQIRTHDQAKACHASSIPTGSRVPENVFLVPHVKLFNFVPPGRGGGG